jgi:hypothetical protein
MGNGAPTLTRPKLPWKELVEVAIFEADQHTLSQRIHDAQDAIMDEIEDTFQTASSSERQALMNAMNALRKIRRRSESPGCTSEEETSHSRKAA